MFELPECETLKLSLNQACLTVLLNRPQAKNAMSFKMVEELKALFASLADSPGGVRAIVIRGAEGNLCAGGDIKDMAAARQAEHTAGEMDPLAKANRVFGELIEQVDKSPLPVIVIAEGAVLGGGFGLVCASDIAFAKADAKFGLPETGLGIAPAQIAPFIVKRVGLTQGRRLAVTGKRLNGEAARDIGLVHEVFSDEAAMDAALKNELQAIFNTAPQALAQTKKLMQGAYEQAANLGALLDAAAIEFGEAARGEEGIEGMMAFIQKRKAYWVPEDSKS